MTEAFAAVPDVELRPLSAQAVAGVLGAVRRGAVLDRYGDLVGGM